MIEENKPFLVIGGEVVPDEEEEFRLEEFRLMNPPRPFEIFAAGRPMKAMVKVYVHADDVVREYDITGVSGTIREFEPSLEDSRFVSIMSAANLLDKEGLDMHDFKEILKSAAWAMEYWGVNDELSKAVDNMHHKLGGPE